MNRKKPYLYKRFIAFVIDLLIVTLLSGIISLIFTDSERYDSSSEKLIELTRKFTALEVERDDYYKEFDELNYTLTKESLSVTIITCGVTVVYFVVLSYFCNGITLGKYIMKLRIKSAKDKKLNILNYLLRSLLVNMLLSNLASIILVSVLSKDSFIAVYPKVSNAITICMLLSVLFMLYRDDGRGIHDLMGSTVVVNMKDEEENSSIEEAKVIEEKPKRGRKKKEVGEK